MPITPVVRSIRAGSSLVAADRDKHCRRQYHGALRPERLFKIVFVCVAWSAAARLLLARDDWKFGDDVPKGPLMQAYGFFVGLVSTLMGVGGGLFANLLMTFYGRPIHRRSRRRRRWRS